MVKYTIYEIVCKDPNVKNIYVGHTKNFKIDIQNIQMNTTIIKNQKYLTTNYIKILEIMEDGIIG